MGQKQPPRDHLCLCDISRKCSLSGPLRALPLSEGMACALHPNVLIYSSLKLNTAVNSPCDSIIQCVCVCSHCNTDEACVPLIKFQNAIKTTKTCLYTSGCWQRGFSQTSQIPAVSNHSPLMLL